MSRRFGNPSWSWGMFAAGGSPVIILQSSMPERSNDKTMWFAMWAKYTTGRNQYWDFDWVDKPTMKAWMLQTYTPKSQDLHAVVRQAN